MQAQNSLPPIPEFFMYWAFQNPEHLQSELHCLNGAPLKIIRPGQLTLDNGPDLRNAVLEINGIRQRGDVEFHLNWQDWFRHGHHHDIRYRQVILHVLWYPPSNLPDQLVQRFPHFVLSRHLRVPPESWIAHMHSLLQEASLPHSLPQLPTSLLKEMAWQRFLRKCSELHHTLQQFGWEQTTYLGLARVLGYSKNSTPFMQLVSQLSPSELLRLVPPIQRSPLVFYVLMGWQAGLLHRALQNIPRQNTTFHQIVQHIVRQYQHKLPYQNQQLIQWQFGRLRPLNSPYLRLAALAQIIHHYQHTSLFQHLLNIFEQRLPLHRLRQAIVQALRLPLSSSFAPLLQSLLHLNQIPTHTLGEQRIHQFTINILLPLFFLWAHHQNSPGFRWYIEDLYFHFPPADQNHILRQFSRQSLPQRAYLQQGLLEWYHRHNFQHTKHQLLAQ